MTESTLPEMAQLTNRIRNHRNVSHIHFNLRGYFIYEPDNDEPIMEITRRTNEEWEVYDVYMSQPEVFADLKDAKLRVLELLN